MNRKILLLALLVTLLVCSSGCRFASDKYWGLPATYGLSQAMEKGAMPEGWVQFYAATTILDIILLPVTAVHDLAVLIFDPPHKSKWEDERLARQMVYGY